MTGRWVKVRYVEELEVIRQRYAEFELLGEPEVRDVGHGSFNPAGKDEPPR